MYKSVIKGIGHYVPDNVVTNDDLAKIMDTNDEWITERTGIKERRHRTSKFDTERASLTAKKLQVSMVSKLLKKRWNQLV